MASDAYRTIQNKINIFILKLVNLWNSVPENAAEAESLGVFKTEINSFLDIKGIR